jgi:exosortase
MPEMTHNDLRLWMNTTRASIIWEAEGRESSVAVSAIGGVSFLVNGKSDGNIIHLAQNTLGIAEACSGLRSLLSLTVLGLVMGYVWCATAGARASVLLLAIPTAIAVNVLRIVGTAVVSERDPELAEGFYHLFSGWLVFLAGFALLFAIARILAAIEHSWRGSPAGGPA